MTTHKYGPNGEAVEKIIERVKVLTFDEARRMGAARGAAWDARGAAWDARYAVNDALLAELTRDLIEPEHYDLLIGPWRSVIEEASEA